MFTRTTGRRYVLPSRASIRWARLKASIRPACEALCIAALLVSPMFADALLH